MFDWIKNNKGLLGMIIFCLIVSINAFINWQNIDEKGLYTVGIVERIEKRGQGSRHVVYQFIANDELLEGSTKNQFYRDESKVKGKKFLVKYEEGNSRNNIMLFEFKLNATVELGTILNEYDSLDIKTSYWKIK